MKLLSEEADPSFSPLALVRSAEVVSVCPWRTGRSGSLLVWEQIIKKGILLGILYCWFRELNIDVSAFDGFLRNITLLSLFVSWKGFFPCLFVSKQWASELEWEWGRGSKPCWEVWEVQRFVTSSDLASGHSVTMGRLPSTKFSEKRDWSSHFLKS